MGIIHQGYRKIISCFWEIPLEIQEDNRLIYVQAHPFFPGEEKWMMLNSPISILPAQVSFVTVPGVDIVCLSSNISLCLLPDKGGALGQPGGC